MSGSLGLYWEALEGVQRVWWPQATIEGSKGRVIYLAALGYAGRLQEVRNTSGGLRPQQEAPWDT